MKDPIIIRQRLTSIDWEIDQLTTERTALEAELARVGLQAAPYPHGFPQEVEYPSGSSKSPTEATLEEILKGNWHFKNPTPEARKVFEALGVPLEADPKYWEEEGFCYVEWYADMAYTVRSLEQCNKDRELILINDKLYFKGDTEWTGIT